MTAPTIAYLHALRRKQLGQDAGDVEALAREAKEANAAAVPKGRARPPGPVRLHLTKHARTRMSQRGMSASDVLAIYINGTTEADRKHPDRTRYRITERGLEHVDGHVAKRLRRFMGDVVVVAAPNEHGPLPAVITVLPFGESTPRGRRP